MLSVEAPKMRKMYGAEGRQCTDHSFTSGTKDFEMRDRCNGHQLRQGWPNVTEMSQQCCGVGEHFVKQAPLTVLLQIPIVMESIIFKKILLIVMK